MLPESADALVNFRTLPGDTVSHIVAHVRDVVNHDRIRIDVLPRFHGTDERISVANSVDLIRFYQTLIGHAAAGTATG